jgi:carboxypeptidase C (cathepsin A)
MATGRGLLFLCFIVATLAAPAGDAISSLPGWNGPLPSAQYSGFVNVGSPPGYPAGQMYYHYWFVASENNPATDPVVVWYNGGPGASSLYGLLVELGPFMLNEDSYDSNYNATGVPSLIYNDYSWSKFANLLITDNPPPVGFSYCDPIGPSGNGTSCGSWNDTLTAQVNLLFLSRWIQLFPEYAKNPLYLVGESYAGIYVPTIAREILNNPGSGINLQGFAVGDGCLGTDVICTNGPNIAAGPWYDIEFFHGHGQVSEDLYNTILDTCPETNLKNGSLNSICNTLVSEMYDSLGGFFEYDLYDDCPMDAYDTQVDSRKRTWWGPPRRASLARRKSQNLDQSWEESTTSGYPCPLNAYGEWLALTSVRNAIHVDPNAYFFDGDNGVGFVYNLTEKNILPFYLNVITNTPLRVLVYNGDADPCINSMITQDTYFNYFAENGLQQTEIWRPWTLDGSRMGGYVTEYLNNKFAFLTIRGSGHMVPEFKPPMAYSFISTWLAAQDYLPYNSSQSAAKAHKGKEAKTATIEK